MRFGTIAILVTWGGLVGAFQPSAHSRILRQCPPSLLLPSNQCVLFSASDDTSSMEQSGKSKSINELLSELGGSFKSKAEETGDKSKQASTKKGKILNAFVSSLYYLLFFVYRAYRGFFVLMPAVFKRVYAKLETAMEGDMLEEESEKTGPDGKISWKTRLTVTMCAVVVTGSYAVGGCIQIMNTFIRAVLNNKSIPDSFKAVAEAMEGQSDKNYGKADASSADGLLP
jgi:hypothetical protein